MLVDAARRGAGYVWYLIIMMPFGEIAYFLAVKIHDPEFMALWHRFTWRPPSLDQVRFEAELTPSFQNRSILAHTLHDDGHFGEATELFRELLASEPEDKPALYGLACSLAGAGQTAAAIDALKQLTTLDFAYAEHAAGSKLAELYDAEDRREEALAMREAVARASGSLAHQTELASALAALGRGAEARALLERGLHEYAHSPRYVQKTQKRSARAARRVLAALG
jgi:Flp pilus assembly protein TadD